MRKTVHVSGFLGSPDSGSVKEFLERITGQGTVYGDPVVKPCKTGPRSYANVQFTSERSAETIISLANRKHLYYGSSYLRAFETNRDVVTKPRPYVYQMDQVALNFGCQVSKTKFSVLRKIEVVSVRFGIGMKKIYFMLNFRRAEYKLELSYENFWQIILHSPRGLDSKRLLIQLIGAPRIFKNIGDSSIDVDDPDQWARTTDFTPSSCIGQSSGICLELPRDIQLPHFSDYFAWYKESDSPFILEACTPYCCNSSLVPIVNPPRGLELPYEILFRVCCLVQNGCLPGPSLNANFFQLVDPRLRNISIIERALENMLFLNECCYDPVTWLTEQYTNYNKLKQVPKSPTLALDEGLVYVHRVQVTPCKVYFCGPEVNVSNRVLRHFIKDIDNFLRVSFVDEEWRKLFATDLSPRNASVRRTEIYYRILSTLQRGIIIGNKKFEFLAFSSSQLRDNSVWMFASRDELTAADIRAWMGDFSNIRNIAKYAARLGQSFSSSTETLSVSREEVENIPDIKVAAVVAQDYIFSDGIGKISSDFAQRVAIKCDIRNSVPSAYQIRYGGFKGVVAVDPTSSRKLSLRPSMKKYDSENTKLDVLAWSKYQPCFLNRQVISLLSTLGVEDHVFQKKQREAVSQLDCILTDPLRAHEALELMPAGENTNDLKEILKCGYKPDSEPFLSMMLEAFRASKLLDLRTKARIFVPSGRSMMGCLDETRTLEYGQVFVQYSRAGHGQLHSCGSQNNAIVEGEVVVAKNPCLHPGDVRILKAVNIPQLHHMVDCVVFPQKGRRPHPNECSGSDLDGDIYFVCWDRDLIPPLQEAPMDYTPAPPENVNHEVTVEELEEYFVKYIVNDTLGVIANAHTVFADKESLKAMSQPCLDLAKLFSIAVDFPKTGVPAEIPRKLYVKEYPDFMEKADKVTYESKNVIGKLYREVKDIDPNLRLIKSFTKEVARKSYDPDMEVDGFEDYVDEAFEYKKEYDYKLGNLMDYYGIKTEAEILSGGIMKMSRFFDRKKDTEAVGMAVKSLRKEARNWFNKGGDTDDSYAKASAWYHVAYHHSFWGCYNEGMEKRPHFISFPWCVYDKLVEIKKSRPQQYGNTLGLF